MITFVAASFTVWWATAKSNDIAAAQQQQIIKTSLSQSLDEMIKQHRSLARWQPLARRLARSPQDTVWLNQNVGDWLSTMFGHQLVYILDAKNQPVYRWENGRNVAVSQFAHLQQPVETFMQKLKVPYASQNGHREAIDFTLIDNRPAVLAMGNIEGERGLSSPFTLVSVKYLDNTYLSSLSQRSLLKDLRYTDGNPIADGANYLLTTHSGQSLGHLSWQPDRPGTRMLAVIGPLVAIVVLIITAICGVMIRRLWLSSLRLSQSVLQLGASEAQAQHLAFHDVLTGLPNRAMVEERLTQALGRLMRNGDKVALLLLDLDRFKLINDTYGHHAGDDLIIEVGHRVSSLVGEQNNVGRLGGDEFVVILDVVSSPREAGFRIALDDFGTGYSSLNYLSHFSVDKIKIDRSFTQSLGVTENSMAIIESVVKLGQAMGLTVTAEGVETQGQMAALAEAGCNQLQGYLFSQAVSEEHIVELLAQRKAS